MSALSPAEAVRNRLQVYCIVTCKVDNYYPLPSFIRLVRTRTYNISFDEAERRVHFVVDIRGLAELHDLLQKRCVSATAEVRGKLKLQTMIDRSLSRKLANSLSESFELKYSIGSSDSRIIVRVGHEDCVLVSLKYGSGHARLAYLKYASYYDLWPNTIIPPSVFVIDAKSPDLDRQLDCAYTAMLKVSEKILSYCR